jgi:hypothetical protein
MGPTDGRITKILSLGMVELVGIELEPLCRQSDAQRSGSRQAKSSASVVAEHAYDSVHPRLIFGVLQVCL